jgi:hypothetical protein
MAAVVIPAFRPARRAGRRVRGLEVPADVDVHVDHAGHQRDVEVVRTGPAWSSRRSSTRGFNHRVRAICCFVEQVGLNRNGILRRAARGGKTHDHSGQGNRGSDRREAMEA